LPYFVRLFGIKDSFICVDGNKRVKAMAERGDQDFRGYVFYPEHVERAFFGPHSRHKEPFSYWWVDQCIPSSRWWKTGMNKTLSESPKCISVD